MSHSDDSRKLGLNFNQYMEHKNPRPPFVIHVREMDAFPDALYIGRKNARWGLPESKWANPYKIGAPTYSRNGIATRDMMTREQVLDYFENYMLSGEGAKLPLVELTDRPLACWCCMSTDTPKEETCHGHVLVRLWWDWWETNHVVNEES